MEHVARSEKRDNHRDHRRRDHYRGGDGEAGGCNQLVPTKMQEGIDRPHKKHGPDMCRTRPLPKISRPPRDQAKYAEEPRTQDHAGDDGFRRGHAVFFKERFGCSVGYIP